MLIDGREFASREGWIAPDSQRENEPHVMITMEHFYAGDEKISRGEILAILAVMMTQLDHDTLQSHYITPVSHSWYLGGIFDFLL